MSFSSKVKGELSLHFGNGRHCEIAEIAAYVNIYGQIAVFGGNFCLKIQTENDYAVKKCFTLLRNTFNMIADVSVRISGQKRQTKVYTLLVRDAVAILQATGILTIEKEQKKLKKRIYPPVVSSICCRRAYIRGAFISVGSVNDPEKNYHLEFDSGRICLRREAAAGLINANFGWMPKVVERKRALYRLSERR